MKHFIFLLGVLAILMAILASSIPILASSPENAPRIHVKDSTSSNWSGYAAFNQTGWDYTLNPPGPTAAAGTITYVAGTWKVPTASAGNTSLATYSSAWVGIDGYASNTVEQLGTEQDYSNGQARYYAWYEMYPKMSQAIKGFTVHAGDIITASVKYSNGKFILSMANNTTSKSFTTTQNANKQMVRSSAEWIMEAPWSGGVLPLTNFGKIDFSNCSFSSTSNANQAIPGTQTTASTTGWVSDSMNMVNSVGAPKDTTSTLNGGNSFAVTWYSSN